MTQILFFPFNVLNPTVMFQQLNFLVFSLMKTLTLNTISSIFRKNCQLHFILSEMQKMFCLLRHLKHCTIRYSIVISFMQCKFGAAQLKVTLKK
jgi:hypothetical protein